MIRENIIIFKKKSKKQFENHFGQLKVPIAAKSNKQAEINPNNPWTMPTPKNNAYQAKPKRPNWHDAPELTLPTLSRLPLPKTPEPLRRFAKETVQKF